MANDAPPPGEKRREAVAAARRLMRLSRVGALATLDSESGAPLTTLVGVASDFDGAPLFLMSTLARHTGHLANDPRASILLTQEPEPGDPLNQPRVTLNGVIEKTSDPRVRIRYLQRNPKAKLYADFADFAFFRLRIQAVHFVGGFGPGDPLTPADILISQKAEAALAEAEPRLIEEINAMGDDILRRAAGQTRSGRWRAVGLDAEGIDLSAGSRAGRLSFPRVAPDVASWRALFAEAAGSVASSRPGEGA